MKTFQFGKIDTKNLTISKLQKNPGSENIDVFTEYVAWEGGLEKILDLFIYDFANTVTGGSKI